MEEDIKKSIIILALDLFASAYEDALENGKILPGDIEEANLYIEVSRNLIQEIGKELDDSPKIKRPKWKA
jgi:hypothetical protein